ncbi:amidohydrolase [Oscillospiraceae bacterium LTW-04]|nr:amidohydrolase [Oscillospiraceae bacterium MB24-C1]
MNIKGQAKQLKDYVIAQRRWLHANPELSTKEFNTTAHIVSELEKSGIEVVKFKECTGAVGIIRGKHAGKTVVLRADIDALPITEPASKPYASQCPGVMHACGHDCHTAMLLGAAKVLVSNPEALHGTVKLLFQMGEEIGIQSEHYVKNGSLDDVDAIFGMHVWSMLDAGTVNFEDDERMASSDRFTITIHGEAAHGSAPNKGSDAIVAAAAVNMALQALVARLNDPLNALVISVGMMNGGQRFNIIADTVELVGTVRTFNRAFRHSIPEQITQIASHAAAIYGCTAQVDYEFLPGPVINEHPALNAIARGAAAKIMGENSLVPLRKMMGAEDFSVLMEKVPGVYGFLGARNRDKGIVCSHHHPEFDVDEDVLECGTAIYAQFAVDYLNAQM